MSQSQNVFGTTLPPAACLPLSFHVALTVTCLHAVDKDWCSGGLNVMNPLLGGGIESEKLVVDKHRDVDKEPDVGT